MSLLFALGAPAQTSSDAAGKPSADGASSATAPVKKSTKRKKKAKKSTAPAPQPDIDEETRKALEGTQPPASATPAAAPAATPPPAVAPAPQAAAPAPEAAPAPAAEVAPQAPTDDEPPQLTSMPVTKAFRGRAFIVTAHATDPSGVFGPVFYLRKRGMPASEYIPMKMTAAKGAAPGDYAVEIAAPLVSVDALEYYIEAWDNAGNGPSRVGDADSPLSISVEEPPKPKAVPKPPVLVEKPKGNPPAIIHPTVSTAVKGRSIELNARLVGETGVSGPSVMFRHVGERDYKALPMGFLGGDDYTATIPGSMATGDIEYYLEAFDKYGNGPGRSGAPNVPYTIKVTDPKPVVQEVAPPQPHLVKAPFSPNPGRTAGWVFMGGFVGGLLFTGGEALAASQAHDSYSHTFSFEGRRDSALLARANTYGSRAKTALIVSGASLVVGVVLLVVFPEHPDTILVGGSGGELGVRF